MKSNANQYKWRVKAGSDLSMVKSCIDHAIVRGSVGGRDEVLKITETPSGYKREVVRWCEVSREQKPA